MRLPFCKLHDLLLKTPSQPEPMALTDPLRSERIAAICLMEEQLITLRQSGFDKSLLDTVADKKTEMILAASSHDDLKKVLNPGSPRYEGGKWVIPQYLTPEEELVTWLMVATRSKLCAEVEARVDELSKKIYRKPNKKSA